MTCSGQCRPAAVDAVIREQECWCNAPLADELGKTEFGNSPANQRIEAHSSYITQAVQQPIDAVPDAKTLWLYREALGKRPMRGRGPHRPYALNPLIRSDTGAGTSVLQLLRETRAARERDDWSI